MPETLVYKLINIRIIAIIDLSPDRINPAKLSESLVGMKRRRFGNKKLVVKIFVTVSRRARKGEKNV